MYFTFSDIETSQLAMILMPQSVVQLVTLKPLAFQFQSNNSRNCLEFVQILGNFARQFSPIVFCTKFAKLNHYGLTKGRACHNYSCAKKNKGAVSKRSLERS